MNSSKTFHQTLIHELNAPLNAIDGYIRLMRDRHAGSDIAAYETMLIRSAARIEEMKFLVAKLLEYSFSKNSNSIISNFELLDIISLAKETIQPILGQKSIQIFIHPNKKVNLDADVSDFEIIFNNLLSNAAKYNIENGIIDISIIISENVLTIQVADTGIGMAQEEMDVVFDEFVRIKNKSTKEISGHGLGLSIVKNIVNSYNGTIELKSTQMKGTIVTIKLPLPVKKEKK